MTEVAKTGGVIIGDESVAINPTADRNQWSRVISSYWSYEPEGLRDVVENGLTHEQMCRIHGFLSEQGTATVTTRMIEKVREIGNGAQYEKKLGHDSEGRNAGLNAS